MKSQGVLKFELAVELDQLPNKKWWPSMRSWDKDLASQHTDEVDNSPAEKPSGEVPWFECDEALTIVYVS